MAPNCLACHTDQADDWAQALEEPASASGEAESAPEFESISAPAKSSSSQNDIQMVLDVCPPLPAEPSVITSAMDQTHRWAERARAAFLDRPERRDGMRAQFGIVQGGLDPALRQRLQRNLKCSPMLVTDPCYSDLIWRSPPSRNFNWR